MDTQTALMAKPRKKRPSPPAPSAEGSEKYRKPNKPVRIRLRLAEVAEEAARVLAQDLTQYVNDAVRERLERAGLWPPKPKG